MPSRGWYIVAALILIGAIAGAVWMAVSRIGGITAAMVQIVVPGGADLDLKSAGTYTIFHERTSHVGDRVYTAADVSGLRVRVRSAATGQEIAVKPPTGSATYNFDGRAGTAVLAFDIGAPGTYRLDAGYADGRLQPQTVLAVGTGFFSGLFAAIALSIGMVLAGIAAAAVLVVVVVLKRQRARRGLT
jgi:hypothetical protein